MSELYTASANRTDSITLEKLLATLNEARKVFDAQPQLKVKVDYYLGRFTEQYRYPASKSKRIRRKFAKKYWRYNWKPEGYLCDLPRMDFSGKTERVLICNEAFLKECGWHSRINEIRKAQPK